MFKIRIIGTWNHDIDSIPVLLDLFFIKIISINYYRDILSQVLWN
jgi:hypothetical protein